MQTKNHLATLCIYINTLNSDKILSYTHKICFLMLFIILLVFANNAHSDELYMIVNGKSFHSGEEKYKNYNERNYGLGMQYDFTSFDKDLVPFINVGGFSDSNENPSYYVGGGLTHRTKFRNGLGSFRIDAGLSAFLMSRVQLEDANQENNILIPGILPMLSIGTRQAAVNITYIPETEMTRASLWFVQLKINMNSFRF